MTTTDERTPLDPTISEIHRLIESIGGRLNAIAAALDALSACPMHEPGDPDCRPSHGGACRPTVDMLAAPDDPLREFRLPSGRVAYQEETVEHVMAGDWFQRRHGDTEWHQVERAPGSDTSICLQYRTPSGPTHEWFERGSKVRIATAPVPDPEPWRRAWR